MKQRELELCVAAQIALLGETPLSLRSLSLSLTENGVHFKAVLDSTATEVEREEISWIATEILASLNSKMTWKEDIIVSDGALRDMELELLVYRRKE